MKKKPFSLSLHLLPYFLLICIGLLCLFPLLHPGLPLTHDGKDHVARIANFYLNLQQGVIIPRWAPNLNWGYGHPVLMFLYPFPSYFTSFVHIFGFSLIDSIKIVFGISFLLSGITMYLWMAKAFNRYAGFMAAVLYMYAPYRFVDLYVRGALGEHVAFIFPPLVLYFLLRLSEKRDGITVSLGALAFAGLLLSHNAISIMFLPVFGLYGIFLLFQSKKKKLFALYVVSSIILGFSLAAFFWIPALLEGKYTLRNIVTDTDYGKRFVPFMDFFSNTWSFEGSAMLSKQVGTLQWVFIFVAGVVTWIWYKRKKSFWQLGVGSIFIFCITLFIMTEGAKIIWDNITILQNFQFPWRFLAVIVFITSFCAGFVVFALPKKFVFSSVVTLSIIAVLLMSPYWKVNGYVSFPDTFFKQIYEGTTDTGESAPIWSIRFMEKRPKASVEIIEGHGSLLEKKRSAVSREYGVKSDEKIRIRENTLYFPGWKIFVDNSQVEPEFQDPKHRGLMTFYVEKGTHTIEIIFGDTKIRSIANSISIFAVLIVGFFCIMRIAILWKHSR